MGLSSDDTRRREVVRDLAAGALLIGALFFPWNLYFGFRIPDSSKTVFGLYHDHSVSTNPPAI
ncbi:hypothetical protein KCQ62_26330, partial [Klebsiella pneumoniae]|nr:hypothetical protein [Klebsiella pneumoniae]